MLRRSIRKARANARSGEHMRAAVRAFARVGPEGVTNSSIGPEPPSEFRIWPFGRVETTKGTFSFTAKSCESVLSAWERGGVDMMLDYEHRAVDPDARAGDGKAAGWCSLEGREDGLWAVDVQWTPAAQSALEAREFRYFSPAFLTSSKGEILELINVALTNLPATYGQLPLVASRGNAMAIDDKDTDAVAAVKRCAEAKVALAEAIEVLASMGLDPDGEPLPEATAEEPAKEPEGDEEKKPVATAEPAGEPDGDEEEEKKVATKRATTALLWKALAEIGVLSRRVASLEKARATSKIAAASAAVPPAFRSDLQKLGEVAPELFDSIVRKFQSLTSTRGTRPGETSLVTLSAEERHAARLAGISEKDFLAHKQARPYMVGGKG